MMSSAASLRPIDLVIERLSGAGCNPRGGPTQWSARCPNQERHKRGDKNPSLSVGEGPDGKALLHCHTGCSLPDVARSLNLTLGDLFPDKPISRIDGGKRIKATYPYYDLDGTLVFEVVRWEPKGFAQRQPDGKGGWTWNLRGIERRPIYHAPQVAAAIADGKPVWIVEGEKDAESLQWAIPEGATTTNAGGAGNWRDEYTAALSGAQLVNIVHDDDDAGLNHARTITKEIAGKVERIVVWRPYSGHNDISEHLGAGRGLDDLVMVWDSAAPDASPDDLDGESDWSVIDLVEIAAKIRDGTIEPITPSLLSVEGDGALFYSGRINSLFGESGGGKTWVALAAVAERLRAGERVLFVDYEDTPHGIAERLVLLGLTDEEIGRLAYRNPSTGLGMGMDEMLAELDECSLLVIDSTGEAMAAGSVNPNADEEVAAWFRRVKDLLALPGAPAIVVLDHVPKATDAPSSYAIGSQRKRAAVTGAAYRVDTIKAPSRGKDGKLKLTVAKDRPGSRAKGRTAALVEIGSDGDAVTMRFHVDATAEGKFRPTVLMERVSRWLEVHPKSPRRAIGDGVSGRRDTVLDALDVLIEEGFVSVENGPRGAQYHVSIRPFREEYDAMVVVDNSDPATVPHRSPTVPGNERTSVPPFPTPLRGGNGGGNVSGHESESYPQGPFPDDWTDF